MGLSFFCLILKATLNAVRFYFRGPCSFPSLYAKYRRHAKARRILDSDWSDDDDDDVS